MKLLIATEALFFISLIIAFVYFAFRPGYDERSIRLLDLKTTGTFSILLFSSSFTFWRAEVNFDKGRPKGLKIWLLLTILLGGIFLFGQGKEYWRLIHEQLTISSNLFGTSFFTLTGFHGFHVFVGLVILSIILALAFLGDFDNPGSPALRTVGLYWHFVDIVWLFVFSIVYVLPHFFKP